MNGLILIDKPAGVSSHDVVAGVRRRLGGARTGHAGTLDPFATGLLLVLVGRATRVQRYLMALPKTYEVVARFGATSTTQDPTGEITVTGTPPPAHLELPTGVVRQRPPAHSAVHVDGERAYRRARRGERVETAERAVTVHRFQERWRDGDRMGLEVECSSGTYVRSLIAALGDAYCEELRRTRIGPFDVADAAPFAPGGPAPDVFPLDRALAFMRTLHLDPDAARRVLHGQSVAGASELDRDALGSDPDAPVLLVDGEGALAVARLDPTRSEVQLRPVVVLRG